MKLKKIEKIIKKSKTVAIVEDEKHIVWIGTERVMYPTCFENMDFDRLMTIFDVAEEKRESITNIPGGMLARANTEDLDQSEILLQKHPLRIVWRGKLLTAVHTEGAKKLLYIDERLLEPVRDIKDGVELYLRVDEKDKPYIAVKNGMLLVGLLEPETAVVDEMLLQQLKTLYDFSSATFRESHTEQDTQERFYD